MYAAVKRERKHRVTEIPHRPGPEMCANSGWGVAIPRPNGPHRCQAGARLGETAPPAPSRPLTFAAFTAYADPSDAGSVDATFEITELPIDAPSGGVARAVPIILSEATLDASCKTP